MSLIYNCIFLYKTTFIIFLYSNKILKHSTYLNNMFQDEVLFLCTTSILSQSYWSCIKYEWLCWPNETRGCEIKTRKIQGLKGNSTPNINDESLKPLKISTFVRDTCSILIGYLPEHPKHGFGPNLTISENKASKIK